MEPCGDAAVMVCLSPTFQPTLTGAVCALPPSMLTARPEGKVLIVTPTRLNPLKLIIWGLLGALSVTLSEPVTVLPGVVGCNSTGKVQFVPGVREVAAAQTFVPVAIVKLLEMVKAVKFKDASPTLETTTLFAITAGPVVAEAMASADDVTFTMRTTLLLASAIYKLPKLATVTAVGPFSVALVAGPASPV